MNQVINLCHVTNGCGANCGTIDGTVRSDFHIIPNHNISCLGNFFMDTIFRHKSESVTSYGCTTMNNDVIANHRIMINRHICFRSTIFPQGYICPNHCIWANPARFTNDCITLNYSARIDGYIFPDSHGRINGSHGMHKGFWLRIGKKESKCLGHGQLGIGYKNAVFTF